MSSRVIVKIGTKSYDTLKEKRYQFLTYLRGLNTTDVKFLNQNTVSTMPNHGADFQWNEARPDELAPKKNGNWTFNFRYLFIKGTTCPIKALVEQIKIFSK